MENCTKQNNSWASCSSSLKVKPLFTVLGFLMIMLTSLNGFSQSCTHTIRLTDTFGDGWNGGRVAVSVNGVAVLTNLGSTFTTGLGPISFTFTATAGQTIRVYRTAAGTYPTEMRIQVVNSAGTVIINTVQPLTGTATTGGSTGVASCPVTGPSLNVPLTGNNSNPCGTNITLYDHAGTGVYGNNANGYTVLNNAGSAVITINGTSSGEACCDYVRVFRGVGTGGALVGTYYMNTAIPTITSLAGEALTVQFISDGSVTGNGFQINVSYAGSCAVTACSGTPAAGTSTISAATGCSGATTTLSATGLTSGTGITYQWQSGPSATGPWTNVAGATASTANVTPTATTFYRLVTTCTSSGLTNATNAVSYTVNTCSGSFTMTDSFGDGWNGATMTLNVNGVPFATYGSTFTAGTSQTINFCLPANSSYSLVYNGGGLYPTEVGASLTINGSVVYSVGAGGGTVGATLTSGTACPIGCAGAPNAGTAAASLLSVCSGSTTALSATGISTGGGITYQWQSSPDNTTWTNIGGATASTYNATVSANTYYRLVTTCTNSGLSANSSSVLVSTVSCCNYTFRMTDSFGDGWNGATMQVRIGATVLQTIGSTFTAGTSQDVLVPMQSGTAYNLFYVGAGLYATEVGIQIIDANNTTIYTLAAGAGAAGTQLTTWTANCPSPCSGTPSAGNTNGSSQVFAGGNTTLGMSVAQSSLGITYQWQSSSSASGPWTNIAGATSATYVAAPTVATYYQCVVTCSNSGLSAVSTPMQVTVNPYCNADYTGYSFTPQNGNEGTVDGDMITNVTISLGATTLLNNTSTAALSSPQYTFYSSLPTITMYPSNTYNVNVTSGAFANQNFAVWIDYNDDNDFYDAGELIGYSSAATTAGYQTISFSINLACTPPFGTHRMRIRDAFATTSSTMDPCATYGWGETEDYLITIVAGTPFAPAFTATPSTPNCVGAQVTYTATAGQTNYAWTFPGTAGVDYTLVSGGTSASNTAVVTYNTSGSNTITMNYASPLGCASSGAINNTITVGAGTFTTTAVAGDVIWRGASSTDWSTTSNWYSYNGTSYAVASGLPSPATRTIIPANNSCVLAQPAVNVAIAGSAKDVIIESGATLTMTTGTLNVSGNFVNNGTFVAGTGTVVFNTAATVSGNATTFNNVDLNNGVNFGSNLSTINGVMTMNTGSWVNTNAPIYGTSSLLRYNTGGAYGRGFEWSTTSGAGYPNDVQVSGLTTINYPNTGGAFSTNLGVRRDLTIDAGSNVYMDYGTGNASGSLTVGRNVTSAGDLSLGNQIGGDIYVGGNWTRTTGNFYANNRAVFFNGATGAQTITKSGGETFPFMIVNKASGNVVLANNVTVSGGLTLTNGLVEVGTNNMVMGGASLTGGSSASYVKTESTGVLSRNVGGTATTFPVGNGTYNPAMVTNTGIADIFTIRVIDNVTANGTGVGATTTEAVVNRTWMIDEATAGGTNATLRLFWNGAGEEINAFSAATAFMAHYVAAASLWDNIGGTVGAGYVETSNNTSFSPFTISSSTTFAPLPVELISLGAQCANEDVIVSWSTASEHNSLNFIVERSENGLNWNEVQTVTAAVNSNTVREYAIEDAGAARGLKYYRLIQTDQDGAQKVYGPVMSNCGSDADMFMSFPNPSDADITLVFNSKKINGSTTLMVRDAHGRVVRSMSLEIQPGTDSMLIPDMELTPGVYYLQLEGESFKTPVIKHSLR